MKIKVYQDKRLSLDRLSVEEKLNVWCNTRAKSLIKDETKIFTSFLFKLYLVYISFFDKNVIINSIQDLRIEIELMQTSSIISKWLSPSILLRDTE